MQTQSEIRSSITNRIVAALKDGLVPWRRPWTTVNDPVRFPTNFISQRPYRGVNTLMLQLTEMEKSYPSGFWATFNQWNYLDCHVRKGERATQIILWKPVTKTKQTDKGEEKSSFPIMRTWSVFNVAQCEGKIADRYRATPNTSGKILEADVHEEFERAVAATQADIRFGGDRAYYSRNQDCICVPKREDFNSFPSFAETILHELSHWSESRLKWTGSYAAGELRAEISACFLASSLGIPNSEDLTNHAAYIKSWLEALENDPKFIFQAATAASKAADFILAFSRPQTEQPIDEELVVEAA